MNKEQVEWEMELTDHSVAKYFCETYHYSRTAPASQYKFLFKENGIPVGVILFGKGANRNIAKPYGLEMENVLELTRVAFKEHHNYLSMYISKAIKHIKNIDKNLKLIVSYADLRHHEGTLYKSSNFKFDNLSKMSGIEYFDDGRWKHQRNMWKEYKAYKEKYGNIKFKDFVSSRFEIRKQSDKARYIKEVRKWRN